MSFSLDIETVRFAIFKFFEMSFKAKDFFKVNCLCDFFTIFAFKGEKKVNSEYYPSFSPLS